MTAGQGVRWVQSVAFALAGVAALLWVLVHAGRSGCE